MLMPNWLARRAESNPEKLALAVGGQRWTFAELDRLASSAARRLAALGIWEGSRVAVLLRNSAEFVALVHAVARIGAVLVPLNTRLTPPELGWQLAEAGANLLITDDTNEAAARAATAELSDLPIVMTGSGPGQFGSIAEADVPLRDQIDLDAVHCIIFTSGTTGAPKGAMLTYGNHWWSAVGSALNLGNHEDDRWLAVLPLFHVGGLSILMRGVIYGIAALVHPAFDPLAVNRAIDADGVTIISVVSVMLQRMLDERGGRPYPASLRCVLLGGGPATRTLLEACAGGGMPVVQTYGLTETASQFVTLAPADALRKLGSAGKPLLPNDLQILKDGAPAAPDEIGEIIVRGPTVTPGYSNRPGSAAQDGWLHTGDLGYLDTEGYLYVVDRRDDLIISGGENVYPAEVEAVLVRHPAIAEAGVIGVADARWGQAPAAAVVLKTGVEATADEVRTYCAGRLARYKVPVRVWFLPELPRNAAGKLLRHALRTAFAEQMAD